MERTVAILAAAIELEVESKLLAAWPACPGHHHISIRLSAPFGLCPKLYSEAVGLLLEKLMNDNPSWRIGFEGSSRDLAFELEL